MFSMLLILTLSDGTFHRREGIMFRFERKFIIHAAKTVPVVHVISRTERRRKEWTSIQTKVLRVDLCAHDEGNKATLPYTTDVTPNNAWSTKPC